MATTVSTTDYDGNGSTTAYSFTFPYLKTEDVKVALNGKTLATTEYTFATATSIQLSSISGSLNTFQTNTQNSSGAPLNGVKVLIYRDTDVAAAKAVFASGSSFRATDLNNNKEQSLYTEQELKDPSNPNNEPNTINGTGNPGQGVGFEGNLYFDTTNNLLFGPKENGAWGTGTASGTTAMHSSTAARVCIDFPVQMRAAPSVVQTADSSATWKFYTGSSNGTATDCDTIESTQNFAMLAFYSVSGSMSAGAAGWFASNKSVARLAVNSEL